MTIIDRKLIADDGKVITNGSLYGTIIDLGAGDKASNYYEITFEEYQSLQEEEVD
ncbi:hypothetical protein [Massilibacteroides sp.]|uniref:hypothetical protein n=1 Tax=Massilibacteroides sp. TaxID=2034766 RepID=UPI00260A6B42|nr:hypothetical protein [Massilibacteroides sp.]MDD4516338.1 hypothetical protein [Massilibacteroides sp.]